MEIREELFKTQDLKHKEFQSKLIPTVNPDFIIGVRIPKLREIAKNAVKENLTVENCLYFEEFMVKGFMIGYNKKSAEEKIIELENFVPLIDNWAVCDSVCSSLKFTNKNKNLVFEFLKNYIYAGEYKTRFAVVMLMNYFLCDEYIDSVLDIFKSIQSDFYYVNMAVAWALSVAYVRYPKKVMLILENKDLPKWVHNKTIQKCCESYRVSKEDKEYLKKLKVI